MTDGTRRFSLRNGARLLWGLTLLTLPVTSFRYFPAGDDTYVRPLAFYPLALLCLILILQVARKEVTLPPVPALTPLIAFLLVALIATAMGILLAPVPLRGQQVLGRTIRAWATVFVGLGFLLAAVWMNRTEEDLKWSIRWLLAGFVVDVVWSGVQAATFYLNVLPKPVVTHWQRAFSMRELIRINRISGMAYEPSWLAGQISTIYVPWLLAALLTGIRVSRSRWLEPGLLGVALLLLLGTYSRGGILTAAFAAAGTLLLVGQSQIRLAWNWFGSGIARSRALLVRLGVVFLCIALAAGTVLFLAQKSYVARLWNTRVSSLSDFLIQNSAGARAAYAWGALSAYNDHPWLGVGLGASGLYIYSGLPDWALTTVPEIARQLSPTNALYPNPKNLYVRLLAETGLIGFVLFMAFLFHILGDTLAALRQGVPRWRYLGIAALFTWLALFAYNMTQDSFAIPNLWINFGILAGMVGTGTGSGS
jgi:O-antigen ligase